MRAYVLLKVMPQDTTELMRKLQDETGITEASLIHGPYDCVAHVEAKDLPGINDAVMRIRAIPGVLETLTCLVVQSWHRSTQ